MLLRNLSARLITINAPMGNEGYDTFYDILPGNNPAVEVPDALCKSAWVQNLIDIGELVSLAAPAPGDDAEELETLRDEAMLHGITVDPSWTVAQLRTAIDNANA